jgi:hypothetical protein
VSPSNTDKALFAVIAIIFIRDHRRIESRSAARQVDPVFMQVPAAFHWIVARHNYRICNK